MALLNVRDQFDIPDDRAYLNAAFLGPLPNAAVEAGRSALTAKARPWTVVTDSFFDPVDRLRSLIAAYLDGDADGIAAIPAVSYGIATAAANVDIPPGSTIANAVTVGVGAAGQVCLASPAAVHFVVDVDGYHAPI